MSNKYEKLMEPGYIGNVKTRNRIIKTGAGLMMWHESETTMNKNVLAYYESLARGGVGLLIVESPTVDYPKGARWRERYRLDQDKYVKGMSQLVKIIKKYDCPTFMQMNHDGPWEVKPSIITDPIYKGAPIAASSVTLDAIHDFHKEKPKALTIKEIEDIIDKFASAAVRAKKAGFDGVDINAASSHLGHNFLSPFWNRRNDKYGGSTENRARFVTEMVQEIKRRNGNDFPVSVCINSAEIGEGAGVDSKQCLTVEEARRIAPLLEKAGADLLHIRSHVLGYHIGGYLPDVLCYPERPIDKKYFPKEYDTRHRGVAINADLAAGIKKVLNIPVLTIGKLDPEVGEKMLRQGKVDFIGMNRRLQADPELPNKIAMGMPETIAPCTACENCLGSRRCRINPYLGTPYNTVDKAKTRKKVIVVGGGPGGMESARVAALRGHDVTLYERSSYLGGLTPVAALVKGVEQEDLPAITKYYRNQLASLGVKLELGREVDAQKIQALKPDAVIVAAGGLTQVPEIPGIDNPKVIKSADFYGLAKFFVKYFSPGFLNKVSKIYLPVSFKFWKHIGKKVVIIGGAIQGCELAEFLAFRGKDVTIVDTEKEMGTGMVDVLMAYLFSWFEKKGVKMISGVKQYVKITDQGLTIKDSKGKEQLLEADTIIPALPLLPNNELAKALKGKVKEIYSVGDCTDPQLIADAIGTAFKTVRKI
ncbi:MAG: FAD-dependent oxidoreductase [Spirochaetes bacterium]|nr:FAD-dependent oxidoreductase [Spirochaetota bacterium]